MEIRMQDLPPMTRAELLALTDRDLPTLSDLLPLRMQDLPRVTRAELLAECSPTATCLPSTTCPRLTSWSRKRF